MAFLVLLKSRPAAEVHFAVSCSSETMTCPINTHTIHLRFSNLYKKASFLYYFFPLVRRSNNTPTVRVSNYVIRKYIFWMWILLLHFMTSFFSAFRIVRQVITETYENDDEFDITYIIIVWIAFLPTLVVPWFIAHWLLIGKQKKSLHITSKMGSLCNVMINCRKPKSEVVFSWSIPELPKRKRKWAHSTYVIGEPQPRVRVQWRRTIGGRAFRPTMRSH